MPARRVVPARSTGKRERIKDPFTQALDHRYDLERKIDELDGWKRATSSSSSTRVAFPDITVHELVLAPDAPAEILIDRNDLEDIDDGDRARPRLPPRRTREARAARREGAADAPRAARARRPDRGADGERVPRRGGAADHAHPRAGDAAQPLRPRPADGRHRLRRLGQDDARGRAGKAARARRASDVLFVCFNRALRDHLREREAKSGVDFHTFHGLCMQLAQRGRSRAARATRRTRPRRSSGTRSCPTRWSRRSSELGPQYDALFVDEAQDLHNHWLDALMLTLARPGRGPRLAVHGRQPAASTTRELDVPDGVPSASTSPSTAATPRRSTAR